MSQNKTVFPGIEPEGDYTPNHGQGYRADNHAYTRSSNSMTGNGTICPGMEQTSNEPVRTIRTNQPAPVKQSGKPIVGFLYSVSRTGIGEYWPLHIGQNIIGNSNECDIILGEGTVSFKHANLHINKMKKPEKTEATISDLGSTNGTLVNDNSVSVARPVECVSGDIITVGENYELLLLLIDTKALGLHLSENFIDIREKDDMYSPNSVPGRGRENMTINEQDFPPRFDPSSTIHSSVYDGGNRPTDSTIGMDSNMGGFKSGGTVGME